MSERAGVYVSGKQGREIRQGKQLVFGLDDAKCLVCGEIKTEAKAFVRDPEKGWAVEWRDFDGWLCCPLCYMSRFGEFAEMLSRAYRQIEGSNFI